MTQTREPALAGEPLKRSSDHGGPSRAWRLSVPSPDPSSSSMPPDSDSNIDERLEPTASRRLSAVLSEFTAAWNPENATLLGAYLERLDPADFSGAIELIYRDYCLAAAAGQKPDRRQYIRGFPRYAAALDRLLGFHEACSSSLLLKCGESAASDRDLPAAGDQVGPYFLRRELGRGSFSRVFLAEEVDLERRLVVVKVATRPTQEPWLLARVRHTHIVEIVAHALVGEGGLHLICMPFAGGATLHDVLAARRGLSVSGQDLLVDLDSIAASEFAAAENMSPAREILARSTYDQAIAWIGARLADALDFALAREVVHGDIKASNILLSADGNPKLLDFNLASDSSGLRHSNEIGGTLAYMAPERLRALAAQAGSSGDSLGGAGSSRSSVGHGRVPGSSAIGVNAEPDLAAHRADIYSLGTVILEAITGRLPDRTPLPSASDEGEGAVSFALMAAAANRFRPARLLIRDAEAAGGRAIPAGLRAILERALDPDPAKRYGRGRELAEDLDRWRSNRSLAFSREPFWSYTLPRTLKRGRRPLVATAAALSFVLGLPAAALVMLNSSRNLEAIARESLHRQWDQSEVYRFRRSTVHWLEDPRYRLGTFQTDAGDTKALEAAGRALKYYGMLEPGDWTRRDDVRYLPPDDRQELKLWLTEQAFRYCLALSELPDSKDDWERARNLCGHFSAVTHLPAFASLAERLDGKLGRTMTTPNANAPQSKSGGPPSGPAVADGGSAPSFSPWLNEYLMGVVAEYDLEPSTDGQTGPTGNNRDPSIESDESCAQRNDRVRDSAARALGHYRNLLALRPESYWGHYRAASACYVLGLFAESVLHLEHCLTIRPDNDAIRGYRAACLAWLQRYPEALEECDRALRGTPEFAEMFRTRAFIRAASGQQDGLSADIQHFELLGRHAPRRLLDQRPQHDPLEVELPPDGMASRIAESSGAHDAQARLSSRLSLFTGSNESAAVDPDELSTRYVLASTIRKAGQLDLAYAEIAKILRLDPDYIPARMMHAVEAIENRHYDEAQRDLSAVLNHPNLIEYIREDPTLLHCFHQVSHELSLSGRAQEGRVLARKAMDLANAVKQFRGESHYVLAQAFATLAKRDPEYAAQAAEELGWVLAANGANLTKYLQDPAYDPVRDQIDATLRHSSNATGDHERLFSTPVTPPL